MNDLEKALREAIANLEIENQNLPEGGKELILKRLQGEITEHEFFRRALLLAQHKEFE